MIIFTAKLLRLDLPKTEGFNDYECISDKLMNL